MNESQQVRVTSYIGAAIYDVQANARSIYHTLSKKANRFRLQSSYIRYNYSSRGLIFTVILVVVLLPRGLVHFDVVVNLQVELNIPCCTF